MNPIHDVKYHNRSSPSVGGPRGVQGSGRAFVYNSQFVMQRLLHLLHAPVCAAIARFRLFSFVGIVHQDIDKYADTFPIDLNTGLLIRLVCVLSGYWHGR